MSEQSQVIAGLEAILFFHGEAVETGKIASLMKISEDKAAEILREYGEKLKNDPERGLVLMRDHRKVELRTKPEFGAVIETLIKENLREELTPAALETLSVIGYLGPIARPMIDYVRGVNSSFTVRGLMLRGLVERAEKSGRFGAYEYQITLEFLSHLGIKSAEELPEYADYRNFLKKIEIKEEATAEISKS